MEPVCFNTGNLRVQNLFVCLVTLQWSRCVSTPETFPTSIPLSSVTQLQWSRCVSTPETSNSSFEYLALALGFNGAGVFQHRKLRGRSKSGNNGPWLQWSRCVSTPETFSIISMRSSICTLQWSRCVSTPETSWGRWRTSQFCLLQWSRCVSTPETIRAGAIKRLSWALQWSRCVSTPETFCLPRNRVDCSCASMEPVCFNTGNAEEEKREAELEAASMEPVCFNTGNTVRIV